MAQTYFSMKIFHKINLLESVQVATVKLAFEYIQIKCKQVKPYMNKKGTCMIYEFSEHSAQLN